MMKELHDVGSFLIMSNINGQWFYDRMADGGKSLRGMARHVGVDPSALTRTFKGQRKMAMDEAGPIAAFLGVPVSEVLKHSGIPLDIGGPREIRLTFTIDKSGTLSPLAQAIDLPETVHDRVKLAIGFTHNRRFVAAQIRATEGPLSMWDDSVVLFSHTDGVNADAMNCPAVCNVTGGKLMLARIESARKTGEARIRTMSGEVVEGALRTASAVIAIIP